MSSKNDDDIELKDFNARPKSDRKDSIQSTSETQIIDEKVEKNTKNDEDSEENLEETPFLSPEEPIQINRLNNDNENNDDVNREAESLLQTVTNNLDDIQIEESTSHQNQSNCDVNDIEANVKKLSLKERIDKYLSVDNPYIRGFKPTKIKLVYLLVLTTTIFVVAFFPNCITSVNYHHIALARNKWTGSVNYDVVYKPGLHFLLPWKEFITFDSTVRYIQLDDIKIFTTDKLEVHASFRVYYLIDRTSLGLLYRKFGLNFEFIVNKVIISELMNAGQKFSIEDFRTNRVLIKTYLKEKLLKRLKSDYYMNLFDFYFNDLKFTNEINRLNLLRMLNGVYNEKANFERTSNITKAETQLQVEKIRNEARVVLSEAEAIAYNQTIKIEKINYDYTLEMVHSSMLNNSLDQLGFYQSDKQSVNRQFISKRILSFCYLSSLINHKNLVFYPRNGESTFSL